MHYDWRLWSFRFLVFSRLLRASILVGFDGIPGDYCRHRRPITCCPNRDDDCTVPILDTLCYCDMFCDRLDGGDCCPDFAAVCRGITKKPNLPPGCIYGGVEYRHGTRIKQNCNKCSCEAHPHDPQVTSWHCEEKPCLIQEDLVQEVNRERFSWRAQNYSEFWGQSLDDGILYRLGTLFPERSVHNMNEILVRVEPGLPRQFDARNKWPSFIHRVRDQGNCGSSWAFSTTSMSSDRLAIQSQGKISASLSPQQLLSCNQHRQKGCEGGYLDRAWYYLRKLGGVSDECYPYSSGRTNDSGDCLIPKSQIGQDRIRCPYGGLLNRTYKMTPPYRISPKESEIMTEIYVNGPVQATFLVHEDFFMYRDGVYQHAPLAERKGRKFSKSGYHSVRILGWGEDTSTGRTIKYWLCDNSWGEQWGDRGLFKIIRGENHCSIETFVVGVWGKGSRRRRNYRIRRVRKMRKRF